MNSHRLWMALLLGMAGVIHADVPVPSFHYYGQVISPFGWPYTAGSDVHITLMTTNNVILDQFDVSEELGSAVNFILEAPMHVGPSDSYGQESVRTGERVRISMTIGGQEMPLANGNSIPAVGSPGGFTRVALYAGTDSDHDGLPDDWEYNLLYYLGGDLDLSRVNPGDDADGDGVSNYREYRSGTDATWSGDRFEMMDMAMTNGLFRVTFSTVPGSPYRPIRGKSMNSTAVWENIQFSMTPTNPPSQDMVVGDGLTKTIYFEPGTNKPGYLRLKIDR